MRTNLISTFLLETTPSPTTESFPTTKSTIVREGRRDRIIFGFTTTYAISVYHH